MYLFVFYESISESLFNGVNNTKISILVLLFQIARFLVMKYTLTISAIRPSFIEDGLFGGLGI